MKCLVCNHDDFKKGTTILPVERDKAILLVTDIPACVCESCGEPYLDEETAREVQGLANGTLSGEVSYTKAVGGS
jgi:YgiT-type zinc finger domain-containing protein